MTGTDKIPTLLVEKSQDLIKLIVPKIADIVTKIGIENIGTPNIKLPDLCLPPEEIKLLIDIRNNITSKINSVSKVVENLAKPIIPLNTIVNTTIKVLQTVSIARTAATIAIPLLPTPPPGAPDPGNAALIALDKLKDLEKNILNPKVTTAKNKINSITEAVSSVNLIFVQIITILNSIDKYLLKCKPDDAPDVISLNSYLTTVVDNANQAAEAPVLGENYKGFILDIVEEQFSPTVKRSKAVAKNNSGIILLQTPLSFTSTPQVLIEELKLIIDKDNLKAD